MILIYTLYTLFYNKYFEFRVFPWYYRSFKFCEHLTDYRNYCSHFKHFHAIFLRILSENYIKIVDNSVVGFAASLATEASYRTVSSYSLAITC